MKPRYLVGGTCILVVGVFIGLSFSGFHREHIIEKAPVRQSPKSVSRTGGAGDDLKAFKKRATDAEADVDTLLQAVQSDLQLRRETEKIPKSIEDLSKALLAADVLAGSQANQCDCGGAVALLIHGAGVDAFVRASNRSSPPYPRKKFARLK